jgi:hypothetical protein
MTIGHHDGPGDIPGIDGSSVQMNVGGLMIRHCRTPGDRPDRYHQRQRRYDFHRDTPAL